MGTQAQSIGSNALRKLQLAEFAISKFYVDKVDENKMVDQAIIEMLAQLDPHSTYANPQEVKDMNESLQGNFDGIGVQFQMVEDTLLVIQPVSNGPSEKIGILAGDRIINVNDTVIAGVKMSTPNIMKHLRGPKGTKARLTIIRRGVKSPLTFTVKRDEIPIHSLDAAYMIAPKTGYIRISSFGATTAKEFKEALLKLQAMKMNNLILDLQGNGGGYLNAAIDVANEFLEAKDMIVYTKGRSTPNSEFRAKGDGIFQRGRLIVLIDEYTASASEIVTGSVQDWDRGVVIGRRSFGKGLVQRPIDLPDGSMIRLTIARYYTPAGRCIQKPYHSTADEALSNKKGNSGDDNIKAYSEDLINRYNRGEMNSADSIHFPDSLKCYTKLLKRTVYSGGGIMPDYFVPIDTTYYSDYYRNLLAQGIVISSVTKYIESHRKELANSYKTFEDFKKHFEVGDDILSQLRNSTVKFDEKQYQTSLPLIKIQLKALIARDLWNMDEYFQIINTNDNSVKKAVEIINSDKYNQRLKKE